MSGRGAGSILGRKGPGGATGDVLSLFLPHSGRGICDVAEDDFAAIIQLRNEKLTLSSVWTPSLHFARTFAGFGLPGEIPT